MFLLLFFIIYSMQYHFASLKHKPDTHLCNDDIIVVALNSE